MIGLPLERSPMTLGEIMRWLEDIRTVMPFKDGLLVMSSSLTFFISIEPTLECSFCLRGNRVIWNSGISSDVESPDISSLTGTGTK